MTEQIQIEECISRDLKLLWIAQKVFSMYLGAPVFRAVNQGR